jgi:cytochrome c
MLRPAIALIGALLAAAAHAADTTPQRQLERFAAEAGAAGDAARGRAFFTGRHGGEWSCSSCHGAPPTGTGKHANTGKAIDPLAPAANPKVFTDTARVDKWFRRNCKDVANRECSAAEKADVLAYLLASGR